MAAPTQSLTVRTIGEEIQQAQFKTEADMAFVNMIYTANAALFKISSYLKQFDGLTHQQYNILRILRGQNRKPISLLAVKSRMLDRNSDVSRIIDRMVRKGLIDRTTCNSDRRQVDLVINDRGLTLLEEVDKGMDQLQTTLHRMPAEQLRQLSHLLDIARAAIATK